MNNINSITFKVTNKTSNNQIRYDNLKLEDILREGTNEREDVQVDNTNIKNKKILSSSFKKDLKYVGYNGFIMSAIEAYSKHLELVIRPDDVWFAIISQFSIYVEKNSTQLKDKFIKTSNDKDEKKKLTVYTNYPILEAPFDKLTIDMANEIEKNIKDPSIKNWIVPSFTTTTDIDRVVFSASLMSITKSYFTFEYATLCGLPKVTLLGSVDDWVNLKERVQRLKEFNLPENSTFSSFFSKLFKSNNKNNISNNNSNDNQMNKWVSLLNPVLDKFIDSSKGNPDIVWWNKIAHKKSGSGSTTINGWITVFCVYDCESNWLGDNFEKSFLDEIDKKNSWLDIPFSSIPRGYLDVPVILKDIDGSTFDTTLYSGHIGVTLNDKSIIKPSLDWCLVVSNN